MVAMMGWSTVMVGVSDPRSLLSEERQGDFTARERMEYHNE